MVTNHHPNVMGAVARQRLDEFRAESERERLVKQAVTGGASRLPHWPDLLAMAAVAATLFMLLVFGSMAMWQPVAASQPGRVLTAERVVSQVLDEHLLDPGAARSARAAAL